MERTYTVPLRKDIISAPRYKRAKRAVRAMRTYLKRHLKTDEVRIGRFLNEHLWSRGIKNPPTKVKINADVRDGIGRAELPGKPLFPPKKEEKAEKPAEAAKAEVAKAPEAPAAEPAPKVDKPAEPAKTPAREAHPVAAKPPVGKKALRKELKAEKPAA